MLCFAVFPFGRNDERLASLFILKLAETQHREVFWAVCYPKLVNLLCLATFKQIPIALMNTISDVLPALINGSGRPVGGILPVTTAMFKIVCTAITLATPATRSIE